jgi:PAS domain S-box-containing protein
MLAPVMSEMLAATPLRLLLVDPDQSFAAQLRELCAGCAKPGFELLWAADVVQAGDLLRARAFDALLLAAEIGPRLSQTPLAHLPKSASNLPKILLTSADDDDTSLFAVRAGAEDYLVKGAFDSRELLRILRYAIERKQVESRLRQSEEFFRLISENVTDLIAVVDRSGRRLYNNPAYERSLGPATELAGTDSFQEIHPEDRIRIQSVFEDTLNSGQGRCTEYRMLLRNGEVRYIESLGSVVRDEFGQPDKIVVVSRDITERRQAMDKLQMTLAQLQRAHDELHAAQARLVQTEKIEALSTFAAGIAHEVRNPLQTILLGVDFLRESIRDPAATDPETNPLVLSDLENAARKADAVIQGLLAFTAYRQQDVQVHNLSGLLEQSLHAVSAELGQRQIRVQLQLAHDLPGVHVDARKIRHVLIKLLLGLADRLPMEAALSLRTCLASISRSPAIGRASTDHPGQTAVCVELEHATLITPEPQVDAAPPEIIRKEDLDLMIVKKVVELYGGIVETRSDAPGLARIRILFRLEPPDKV